MKIEIQTATYEFSHGKSPRGRGSWAFGLSANSTGDNIVWVAGPYADAKKQAAKIFADRLAVANPTLTHAAVHVLP